MEGRARRVLACLVGVFVWWWDVEINGGYLLLMSRFRFSAPFASMSRTPADPPTEPNRYEPNSKTNVQR